MADTGRPLVINPDWFLGWLRVLVTPSCWLQNHKYSKEWDRTLRDLMARHRFTARGRHAAYLGDVSVWTANHPYASMSPEDEVVENPSARTPRPSRRTILEAGAKLERECPHQDRDAYWQRRRKELFPDA